MNERSKRSMMYEKQFLCLFTVIDQFHHQYVISTVIPMSTYL